MPSSNVLNPHKPLLWILLVAMAAAFFASGALVARATLDKDDTPASAGENVVTPNPPAGPGAFNRPVGLATAPNWAAGSGANGATTAEFDDKGGAPMTDAAYGRGGYWGGGCRAPLPGGVISGNAIDLAGSGFTMNVPSAGFTLVALSLSTYAECDANGQPAETGDMVLDTTWRHTETGLETNISQRVSGEAVAPVMRMDSATFSANGYVYTVYVNRYNVYPLAGDGGRDLPYPDGDPRATQVLNQLVGQLNPNLALQCFWTETQGDWSSLAAMGIGDPRPAIPAGYTQNDLWVTTFKAPAAGCDTSVVPTEGGSFNAGWSSSDGSQYIGVSAWAMPTGYVETYPGQVSSWGANWSNTKFQFSVYVSNNGNQGDLEVVRAIARALDGSYSEQCFIEERVLSEGDLAGLGFNSPALPEGYTVTRSYLSGTNIAAGCTKPDGFEPYYNLSWTLENGADTIDVSVSRYGSSKGETGGYISDYGLNWGSANGDYFSVNAWSKGVVGTVSQDVLIAVAQSMDPTLDVSKLNKETGGGGRPPMPASEPDVQSAGAGR